MGGPELLNLAEAAAPELFGRGQRDAVERLSAHHDELIRVLREAATAEPAVAIRLAAALWRYWFLRGHLALAIPILTDAVQTAGNEPPAVRARGLATLAVMCFFTGRHDEAERCTAEFSAIGVADDPVSTAFAETVVGWVAQARGNWAAASEAFRKSLDRFRSIDHRWGEALSLLNLGEVARSAGDGKTARRYYEEDLEIYRELGEQSAIAATLCNLGFLDLAEGHDPSPRFIEALDSCLVVGNRQFIPAILIGFARRYASLGEVDLAVRLVGVADDAIARIGSAYEPADQLERDALILGIAKLRGDAETRECLAAARHLRLEDLLEDIHERERHGSRAPR